MASLTMFRTIALWIPLGVTGLCVLAQLCAMPFLPQDVAVHWGFNGEPDNWMPAWTNIAITAILGVVVSLLFGLTAVFGARPANQNPQPRFLVGASWFVSGGLLITVTALFVSQAWNSAPGGPGLLAGPIVGIILGVLAATLVPVPPRPAGESRDPAQWTASTGAAWHGGHTITALALAVVFGAAVQLFAVSGNIVWVGGTALLLSTAIGAPAQLLTLARIDARGVSVRSPLGMPRVTIPLRDIKSFERITIDPARDLGRIGWNTRIGAPQEGVAIRAGEGLRIHRTNGVDFLLATDDAAAAEQALGAQLAAERSSRR